MIPALVVAGFYRARWLSCYLLLLAGLLIDADHLLATPIYDSLRCSIGFHPLHTLPATTLYVALLFNRRTRVLAVGLLIHLLLDTADCLTMVGGVEQLGRFLEVPAWIQSLK